MGQQPKPVGRSRQRRYVKIDGSTIAAPCEQHTRTPSLSVGTGDVGGHWRAVVGGGGGVGVSSNRRSQTEQA